MIEGTARIIFNQVVSPLPAAMHCIHPSPSFRTWCEISLQQRTTLQCISTRIGRIFANLATLSPSSTSALPDALMLQCLNQCCLVKDFSTSFWL